ncbi:MAG: pre-peptidase C-terminal domain-containing protein, partial [Pirellula sp.]
MTPSKQELSQSAQTMQKKRMRWNIKQRRRNLAFELLEGRQMMASIQFSNASGGNWSLASNWDLGRIPAAGDDVIIPDFVGSPTITIGSGNFASQSIVSFEKLVVQGTLVVASTINATGTIELQGGTISNASFSAQTSVVGTSSGGYLSSAVVNGDLDLSRQANANVGISGGLVLNGNMLLGDAAGTTYGRVYFGNLSVAAGALTGTGTVVFGGHGSSFLGNYSNLAGTSGALTIGPNITIRGKNGDIFNNYTNGSLVNQGTINADVAGGTINVGNGATPFSNTGTINVSTGTLGLKGSMTLSGLGTINRTGGTINLGGTLDLQGATWNLNATTGSWTLVGGHVKNGTIAQSNGSSLLMTNSSGGLLTSITLNGDLDLSRQANANVSIVGGLVLNGNMLLGDTAGTTYGRIYFGNLSVAAGALTGTGTVVFGGHGSSFLGNYSNLAGTSGALTIGPNITIRGKNGDIFNNYTNGSLVNQGTINADVAGGTIHVGNGATPFSNAGTINVSTGTLGLNGSMTLSGMGTINRTGGTINLGGTLDLQGATWNLNATTGSWTLVGGHVKNGTITQSNGSSLLMTNSSGGLLTSITLNGDLDLSRQSNANVGISGGLVLNGNMLLGDAAGTTYGRVYFGNLSVAAGALTGTGTVVFGGHGSSFLGNYSNLAGTSGALTIGPNITIRGKNGDIFNNYTNGSLVNQGTINADVAGGTIHVGNGATFFSNTGTINVSTGTLGLNGSMTLSGLGTINRTGGTINLGGTLDLQAGTWNLNAATGSWNLLGGTVKNGTIIETSGSLLVMTSNGGVFSGITVNGDLDMTRQTNTTLRVYGGLVLNGTMSLGDTAGSTYGRIYFGDSSNPAGSLMGTGTVVFGGHSANFIMNDSNQTVAAGTLTIGPNILVRGKSGSIFNNWNNGSLANQGTINADVAGGTINLGGNGTSTFTNSGTINVLNGSTLVVPTQLVLSTTAILNVASSSTLQVSGSLTSATNNPVIFRPQGSIKLSGGNSTTPRKLEVMGQDLGPVSSGFVSSNFVFGSLNLTTNTYAKLYDEFDNTAGSAAEALYVTSLVIPANSTLDLNGLKIYTRAFQQSGTVVNGSVVVIPDSGPIVLSTPTPGAINPAGQLDEWTLYVRAGRSLSIEVITGSNGQPTPLTPFLTWGRVQLLDPSDNVISTTSAATSGQPLRLTDVSVPVDGVYRIRVSAAISQPASVGNYFITTWDTTATVRPLSFNQTSNGGLATPFAVDRWNFSASAGQQVRFDWIAASTQNILFTLTGPSGYVAFTDVGADSALITLPNAGSYSLTARSPVGALGNYSFAMLLTSQTDLLLNTPYVGTLTGNGQAHLYRVDVPTSQVLSISLTDTATTGRTELYARYGTPPTRETYDLSATGPGRSQSLVLPSATPGSWYFLVYGESIPVSGSYTMLARGDSARITDVYPRKSGNAAPTVLTVTGAGFTQGTTVDLVASNGTTIYNPVSSSVDMFTQISATFVSGLPTDTYSVRVNRGGNIDVLNSALQVTQGGQSRLETQLILPSALGRPTPATLYVEYANTGDLAMPAPLLSLQSADADNSDKPILTLDQTRLVENFWSSGLTPGTSNSVLILGSGKQPSILNPGERIRVPVYYLGLLRPWNMSDSQIELEIRYWTESDTAAIDWPARQEELRPPTLGTDQWGAVYGNLTSGLPTSGDYVRMLNQNATYLGRLGDNVTGVDDLWNFEVQQAYGFTAVPTLDSVVDASMPSPGVSLQFSRSYSNSIYSRYQTGPIGRGWSAPWQTKLTSQNNANLVQIVGQDGSARSFTRDTRNGNYFSGIGDSSKLVAIGGSVFELQAVSGTLTRFRADGKIDYVADTNNNRVTAGYNAAGKLTLLTHTSGATLTIAYNTAGLISSVTDSAGRATVYTYDATNTYLSTVTTSDGKVTQYTYQTSGAVQTKNALLSIGRGGTTQFFSYDTRGRLDTSYLTGNSQFVNYAYDDTGLVTVDDDLATAGLTSLYFDHNGQLAKTTDPLGNSSTNEFDNNLRLSKTVGPTGESQSFTWCSCGSMTSVTNELGQKTSFTYNTAVGSGFNRMSSFTDAKGNATRYNYDSKGNLLETIYPDGSIERLSSYTPAGLPGVSTN